MAALIWLRIVSIAIVVHLLTGTALAQEGAGCERETVSALSSPDDDWVALVQEDICSDGAFVTTVTDTIQLARQDLTPPVQLSWHAEEPKHENDVFALDEHGRPENRPITQWLSPRKLQIAIPNLSLIGLKKPSYQGGRDHRETRAR
jgi:hypothetical protein